MYDFDLRTGDSAYSFLLDFFNMSREEYQKEFRIDCKEDIENFCKCNISKVKDISLEDIRIWGFHVLGSLDECKEIRSQGLKNLQKVLSEDTALRRMLKSYGISFDIESIAYNYIRENK